MGKEKGGLSTGIHLSPYSVQITHLLAGAPIRVVLPSSFSFIWSFSKPLCAWLTKALPVQSCWLSKLIIAMLGINSDLIYFSMKKCRRQMFIQRPVKGKRWCRIHSMIMWFTNISVKWNVFYNCWARKITILMSSTKVINPHCQVLFWQCYLQFDKDTSKWST